MSQTQRDEERIGTKLTCHECAHSFEIDGRETGHHTDHCQKCDTPDPGFDLETVRR